MRQVENEGAHIWLRQSATFSVNGQTRTVEIAIPLRPGATPEEVELLLSEADAGMERLSQHLDSRVAALTSGAPGEPVSAPPAPAAAASTPSTMPAPSATNAQSARPGTATPAVLTAAPTAPATPSTDSRPPMTPSRSESVPASRPTPSAPPLSPAPTPAPARGRASGPLTPAAAGSAGADLSRPEFIKAAGELGLDVRQAMQRLGVRSLEGLNLRESLELLRRQAVRGEEPAPAAGSGHTPAASSRSAVRPAPVHPAAPARPSGAPSPASEPGPAYAFDEEEEPELTFTIDGDDELDEAFGSYSTVSGTSAGGADGEDYDELDELDELDLDDVPDFGPPAPAHAAPARRGSAPAASAAAPTPEPERSGAPASAAGELIARLRAAHAGGVMSGQQRTAYRNIVVNELGEARAAGLVRGLWNVTPERLGAEQADELLSWGKRDTFADEATQVLAELRAERERGAGDGAPTSGTTSRQGARGRPAARRVSDTAGGF